MVGSRLKFSTAWTAPAGTRAPGRGRRPRRSADAGGAGDDDLLFRSPSGEGDRGTGQGRTGFESRTGKGGTFRQEPRGASLLGPLGVREGFPQTRLGAAPGTVRPLFR